MFCMLGCDKLVKAFKNIKYCLKATLKAMQYKNQEKPIMWLEDLWNFFFLILGYKKYQLIMYIMT